MSIEDADLATRFHASIEKARHFISVDRSDLAERVLRESLRDYPDEPVLHGLLAIALCEVERFAEAEEEAALALRLDPECIPALRVLASVRVNAGKHREAEAFLLDALRLDPNNPDVLVAYGMLMIKTGHLEKAERLMEAALREDPEHSEAHSLRAVILAEKRKQRPATASGERGLNLEPESPLSHLGLGTAYLQGGHPFLARHHLREALRLSPDPEIEGIYREADLACRWICLPLYYFELLLERLPGRQFTLWAVVVALLTALRGVEGAEGYVIALALWWVAFCIYTWVATPLAKVWVRLRPPR